jgi:hypothetical protein
MLGRRSLCLISDLVAVGLPGSNRLLCDRLGYKASLGD